METSDTNMEAMMAAPDFDPEQLGARFWYEQYLRQRVESAEIRSQMTQPQTEVERQNAEWICAPFLQLTFPR